MPSLKSALALITTAVLALTGVLTWGAPAHAAPSGSINDSSLANPGGQNLSEIIVTISGLPATINYAELHFSGISNVSQSASWQAITTVSDNFTNCPGTQVGISTALTASAQCNIATTTVQWHPASATNVGGEIRFRFPAGSLQFAATGAYTITPFNGSTALSALTLTSTIAQTTPLEFGSSLGTFSQPFTLTATGGDSSGTISYSLVSGGSASGCNLEANILTTTSAGTCVVTATRAGDETYSSLTSPQTTITFAKASRTLAFTTSPTSIAYGSTATVVATPSESGGAVSYASTGSTSCTVDSSTGVVTATQSSGTCEITATVAEGTNYLTASVATPLVITTGTKPVTITASNADVNFGTTVTTNVLNTSSLGLVGSDSIESSGATFTYQGTGSTVYGPSTVKPTNAGTYSVTPSAAVLATGSTSNYNFTYVAGTVSISKVSRTLAFGGGGSATVNYGNTLSVAANPSAGDGAVTYSAGSSTGCSVNASTGVVTATNSSGTCAISASIAAGTNHLTAATGSSFTVTLAKKNITLKTADLEVTEGGDVEPATEVSVGALVGSDAISSATFTFVGTGTTTYGPSNVAPTAIGTYDVTPSVPVFGAGSATNYTIAFAAGALTINVRPPAPSPGGVAAQPVVGPAIAGVTARGSENGKGSFLRVRLDKTPAAFEQLTVVVRLLDLKGELVEELRIPVSQGSSMLEIPINRPMGQFNAVAQISSSTATNAAAKLRPAPLQHSTIREATEEKPIRLLGKRLSQPVLFTAESAKLTPAIKRELRKAARVAKESGSRLAVTGFHALSGRGEAFEQSLAEKRALRVARYLRKQGVENWILFDGLSGAEGQQFPGQPRRVEIRVLK